MGQALLVKRTPGPPRLRQLSLETSPTTSPDWLWVCRKSNKFHLKTTYVLCQSGLRLGRNAVRGKRETLVIPPSDSRSGFCWMVDGGDAARVTRPQQPQRPSSYSITLGPLSEDVSHFCCCRTAAAMTHAVSGEEGSRSHSKSPDCSEKWCRGSIQLQSFPLLIRSSTRLCFAYTTFNGTNDLLLLFI